MLAIAAVTSVNSEDSTCHELLKHAVNLRNRQARKTCNYLPYRECPEEYKSMLNRLEGASVDNFNALCVFIDELIDSIEGEREFQPCLVQLLRRKTPNERKMEVALTYAYFFKAEMQFQDGLIVPALIDIKRLKLLRREMQGVTIDKLLAFEDTLLTSLADACDNAAYEAMGIGLYLDDNAQDSLYETLRRLTNPYNPENDWDSEKETMTLVHEVLEHAHNLSTRNMQRSPNGNII